MLFNPQKDGVNPKERALWADLMSLGMVFPSAIVLGFFIGRWIGGQFGHAAGGQWVGLIWGIATGFWELYKVSMRMNRMDQANKAEKAPEVEPKEGKGDGD